MKDDLNMEGLRAALNRVTVNELPDDLRAPLHSLQADLDYLITRARQEDDEVADMIRDSIRSRLSQIEEASYRLANPPTLPSIPAEPSTPVAETAGVTEAMVEAAARAIYNLDPAEDQETDLDGRPTSAVYAIPWESIAEFDAPAVNHYRTEARTILEAALSAPSVKQDAGWRAIGDGAPKDGTRILIKTVTFGWSSDICQHVATGEKWVEARWAKDLSGEERWLEWCGSEKTHTTDNLTPTAWAPTPPQPGEGVR